LNATRRFFFISSKFNEEPNEKLFPQNYIHSN
jgi:hypothetical protein